MYCRELFAFSRRPRTRIFEGCFPFVIADPGRAEYNKSGYCPSIRSEAVETPDYAKNYGRPAGMARPATEAPLRRYLNSTSRRPGGHNAVRTDVYAAAVVSSCNIRVEITIESLV